MEERQKINKKKRRGDWCSKLRVFEGMTQPLIQVFKYLMQGGIKWDRLAMELSVKMRIYYRIFVCVREREREFVCVYEYREDLTVWQSRAKPCVCCRRNLLNTNLPTQPDTTSPPVSTNNPTFSSLKCFSAVLQ